jgi:hypothetical protein
MFMKNLKFLQILILLVSLSSCSSCEEEEWTTLPPETQTGANTFGCYVNGELFVAEGIVALGEPSPRAVYSRSNDGLGISGYWKQDRRYVYLYIYNPKEHSTNLELTIYLRDYNSDIIFDAKKEEITGKVYLTKFDTINKIVSGHFSNIKLYDPQENSILITQGRFDIKLEIYNN